MKDNIYIYPNIWLKQHLLIIILFKYKILIEYFFITFLDNFCN